MNKHQFDTIIKENLADRGGNQFGYMVGGRAEPYDNYYSKPEFEHFLAEMRSTEYRKFYRCYDDGKGRELQEHKGRYGIHPPKMASVASSSRFCYLALRDHDKRLGGVEFEKSCPIRDVRGIAPQLDAYIPQEHVYIEAKCHEIFDHHRVILKKKYWDKLYGKDSDFGFPAAAAPDSEEFEVELAAFGITKPSAMFDIKQLVCHLLGIASAEDQPAALVYLFFKPRSDRYREEIDEVFCALVEEITAIFNSKPIGTFCQKHQIQLEAVAQYAKTMEPLTNANTITLVKQE